MGNPAHPSVYLIGGPNGAGKTTFAQEFLPHYARCPNFVNADLIAQGISPFSPASAGVRAGRVLLQQIQDLARRREDFGFETTLAGRTYLTFLHRLKREGYRIHLFYLWIPSVELSLARIRDRVARGGHDVPVKDVRRRFSRSLENFFRFYRSLADTWWLFDNSTEKPSLVAQEQHGKLEVVNGDLFDRISRSGRA